MKITLQNFAEENSNSKKGKVEAFSSIYAEAINPWPYRIKLTTDSMRWDSLKIMPSKEFDDHILEKMPEASQNAFDAWHPVEVSLYDLDTHETYKANLAKKESFWFEPFADIGQRNAKSTSVSDINTLECSWYEFREQRKECAYSLQPFRHIIKKRSLKYDQEIGLRWSGGKTVNKMDFSILYAPRLELHNLKCPFSIR